MTKPAPLTLALSISVLILAACAEQPKPIPQIPPKAELTAPDISDYKSWEPITNSFTSVSTDRMSLCVEVAIPEGYASDHPFTTPPPDPKIGFVRVSVNETGKEALLHQKNPDFPAGSIIVKSKFDTRESREPAHHTVMHKLPAGTSPETGDWQYLVYTSDAKTELKNHNLPDCKSCHEQWKDTDYVSREYLTKDQLAKLR